MSTNLRPLSIRALAQGVISDFRRLFVPLACFEVVFKSVVAVLSLGAGALILAILMRSTGTAAVTNNDIVDFVLSPMGVLAVAILGLSSLFFIILEHLGVMAIVARFQRGGKVTAIGISATLAALGVRLLRLKTKGLLFLALTAVPLALLAGLTYAALLTRHDINYYLADRPPSFLLAAAIGGVLGAIFLGVFAYAYVRTILLFPIVLYEDESPKVALQESLRRTRGAIVRLGGILLFWQLIGLAFSALALRAFAVVAGLVLKVVAARFWAMVPALALLLTFHTLLLAVMSFLLVAIHCLIILELYRERNAAVGMESPDGLISISQGDIPGIRALERYWKLGLLVSAAVFAALCFTLLQRFAPPGTVIVTAHKGYSAVAPENSLSAFRKAIEIGADYAELDVQATLDGEVIVNHDRDLMRVGGEPRRIKDLTLAQVKAVDIGRRFSPEFAGERVPTLKEVIALARGKIKLQIELKFYDRDRALAGKVAKLLEEEQFESHCVVSSLNYEGLQDVRRANPRLRTAAIVTVSIGDIDRLDVDGLSVNHRNLGNALIRAMRARHKDLYAWTVDDPRKMITLIERGVPNIVTNRPDLLVRLRSEFADLSDIERRLLAARYLLGLESELGDGAGSAPASADAEDDSP